MTVSQSNPTGIMELMKIFVGLLFISGWLWGSTSNVVITPISDAIHIRVHSFEELGMASKVQSKLIELGAEEASSTVVDLRNNDGGYIHEAMEFAALFVVTDNLIELVERDGTEKMVTRPSDHPYIPSNQLILLIDSKTASAAEAAAHILQKHPKVVTVGITSHGKTTISSANDSPSPYAAYVLPMAHNAKYIDGVIIKSNQDDLIRSILAQINQ